MNISKILKLLIRKPLHLLGVDLVRYEPPKLAVIEYEIPEVERLIWLSSLNINTIIDIGAHTGEFSRSIRRLLPHPSIIAFEPLEKPYGELVNRMAEASNFKAFRCALGDCNIMKTDMHRNEFTPSSSLLEMADLHKQAFPYTAQESSETVEVRRLDDVMADMPLIDNILIKIDVQGYEDKVIRGGEKLISRAKVLIIEASFHKLYEGQPLFDEIYRSLREKGFRYIGNLTQLYHPGDGTVLQADLILTR